MTTIRIGFHVSGSISIFEASVRREGTSPVQEPLSTTQSVEKIAIIGAGLSGLTCAQRLKNAGIDVRLFDKARGPGGRLCTRRREGDHFDHGAQFMTAHGTEFSAELKRWETAGIIAPWRARFAIRTPNGLQAIEPHRERWVGVPRMSHRTIPEHRRTSTTWVSSDGAQAQENTWWVQRGGWARRWSV